MFFQLFARTLWILICGMTSMEVLAGCPTATKNRTFGFVLYYFGGTSSTNQETCDWEFKTTRSDVVFSMQLSYYYGDAVVHTFAAPDGKQIFSKRYAGWSEGWCGSYVKRNSGNETTCKAIKYPTMCKNISTVSLTWPPQIRTMVTADYTNSYKRIKIVYAFLECPTRNTNSITTAKSPTGFDTQDTTTVETNMKHSSINPTDIDTSSTTNSRSNKDSSAIIIATTLGVLIIFTLGCIAVGAVKYKNLQKELLSAQRRLTNDPAGQPSPGDMRTTSSTTGARSTGTEPRRGMVDNVLYGSASASGEQRTVYNELYKL